MSYYTHKNIECFVCGPMEVELSICFCRIRQVAFIGSRVEIVGDIFAQIRVKLRIHSMIYRFFFIGAQET